MTNRTPSNTLWRSLRTAATHLPLVLLAILIAAAGCAGYRVDPGWPQASAAQRNELVERYWLSDHGMVDLKQAVVIEARGKVISCLGFARIAADHVRLVAMNEMGITLLDMDVNAMGHTVHYLSPLLAGAGGRAEPLFAEATRDIYIYPRIAGDTPVWSTPEGLVAEGMAGRVYVQADPAGAAFRAFDRGRSWQVEYKDHFITAGRHVPRTIRYTNNAAGLVLTAQTIEALTP